MQISINIDDTKISELVNKGIEEVDRETLGKIVNEAMKKVFENPEMVSGLVFKQTVGYSGTTYGDPKDWIMDIIRDSVTPEDLEKWKKIVFDTLEKDGKNIIIATLANVLASNMFSYDNQRQFAHEITEWVMRDK